MDKPFPEQRTITSPAAIEMLTNRRSLRYLVPFMREAHTLSTAAAALDKPASTVAYWIPRFVRVGLVEHLGDQSRGGMAMPRYRAVARQLTVPFRKVPLDSRVALLDQGRMSVLRRFLDGLDEAIEKSDAFSLSFTPTTGSGTAIEMLESDDPPRRHPYTDGWVTFHLSEADAIACAQELEAVVAKYTEHTGPRRYIAHVGLAPDPRHRWRSFNDPNPL